jgi:hypothetical protein
MRYFRPLAFLISMVFATLLWVAARMAETYEYTISYPLAYDHMPVRAKLQSDLPQDLRIRVRGKGLEMLLPSLYFLNDSVRVDIGSYLQQQYLPTARLQDTLLSILPEGLEIKRIQPDTIYLKTTPKVFKKVPLHSRVQAQMAPGYLPVGGVILTPDSVTLMGTESDLANVRIWYTDSIVLGPLKSNTAIEVDLLTDSDVIPSPRHVRVEISPALFAEKVVRVPIQVINLPQGHELVLETQEVDIRFLLPFANYDQISRKNFRVRLDMAQQSLDQTLLFPELVAQPEGILLRGIFPSALTYSLRIRD